MKVAQTVTRIPIVIDSHVHLNRSELDEDRAAVIDRARAAGVRGFLNIGYDVATSRASIAPAARSSD